MEVKVDNTLKWRLMLSEARLKNFWNLKNKQTFHFNNHSQIFSLCLNFSLCHRKIFSLCLKIFPCVKAKFPVFSLSGKSKNQIPCFPCAVATLWVNQELAAFRLIPRFLEMRVFYFGWCSFWVNCYSKIRLVKNCGVTKCHRKLIQKPRIKPLRRL